jgi:hypothetical protein
MFYYLLLDYMTLTQPTTQYKIQNLPPLYQPYIVDISNKPFIEKWMLMSASWMSIKILQLHNFYKLK